MKLWQKCPICDGKGIVSGGYFGNPGYIDENGYSHWAAGNAAETCKVCGGTGLIETPEQDTPPCYP